MKAEKVCGKLNDAQKALLFPILARLSRRREMGARRRIAQRDEFGPEKQKLIAHLSSEEGGRLLLAGDGAVEIAHRLSPDGPGFARRGKNSLSTSTSWAVSWTRPKPGRKKRSTTVPNILPRAPISRPFRHWRSGAMTGSRTESTNSSRRRTKLMRPRKNHIETAGFLVADIRHTGGDRLAGCGSHRMDFAWSEHEPRAEHQDDLRRDH
jgi:hypothetical protein